MENSADITTTAIDYTTVDTKDFAEKIKSPDVILVDVRQPDEYAEGHIEGAINIDVNNADFVETALKRLPKDKIIAVYCRSGKRSALASGILSKLGYEILNLDGGIMAWIDNKMPVVK